jgi:hypothetical protein
MTQEERGRLHIRASCHKTGKSKNAGARGVFSQGRSGLDERLADRNQREFGLVRDPQFLFDIVEMRADG